MEITQNGEFTISPSSGYDGMSSVAGTVNVPTGAKVYKISGTGGELVNLPDGFVDPPDDTSPDWTATLSISGTDEWYPEDPEEEPVVEEFSGIFPFYYYDYVSATIGFGSSDTQFNFRLEGYGLSFTDGYLAESQVVVDENLHWTITIFDNRS